MVERLRADPKREVTQPEHIISGGVRITQVFARPQQKVEAKDQTLGGGQGFGSVLGMCQRDHLGEQGQREWLDARRGVVGFRPRLIKRREAEVDITMRVQARVRGPSPAYACPTARTASSTVQDRTGQRLGAMVPLRKRWAKTWRRGTGSAGR